MAWWLRPAAASDRAFLYALHGRTMRDVVERAWGWDEAWQETDFARRLAACEASVIVADETAVGVLMLEPKAQVLHVSQVQILPEHQGLGLGSWAVEQAIERGRRDRVDLTLSVLRTNPRAQRLYQRLGFEIASVDEPFIRMRLPLARLDAREVPWARVCKRAGVEPAPAASEFKLGIALDTLHLEPLNGLRHPAEAGTCGWYIWGGQTLSQEAEFFQPLCVAHVADRCPRALKYLSLPPGWRFLDAPGFEDVWFDAQLLAIDDRAVDDPR
jgi:ribosomal protein S18 acetylase RimI-like enzyme